MEPRRLGLVNKAMLVVPGHCLAQAAREFLALYPSTRILVADETNFVKEKRHRFLSIPVPSAFEAQMIQDELEAYEELLGKVDSQDRLSRKRIERITIAQYQTTFAIKTNLWRCRHRRRHLFTFPQLSIWAC
jgi:N12 class adenine-specific DNA methylase